MKIKEIFQILERFAPLPLQESYDNAGLQIGLTDVDVSGVLLCLDVTEAVIEEAAGKKCNLIVAHHPLLFRGVKRIAEEDIVQRCIRSAIKNDITIYAAHTNLDNAKDGVNGMIADKIGLTKRRFLQPLSDKEGGSGLIGELPEPVDSMDFLQKIKSVFQVECLHYAAGRQKEIKRAALCGGAGDFLLKEAIRQKADIFLTGEMGYHLYFGHENDLWIGVLGHYQSEQYTVLLFRNLLSRALPDLPLHCSQENTNPIHYLY